MSAEMLAGAEALIRGDTAVCHTIHENLIERLGRVPLKSTANSSPAYRAAQKASSDKFRYLPTLARAYSIGAIEVISSQYVHRLIPDQIASAFNERWRAAARQDPSIDAFIDLVQRPTDQS